MDDKVIFFDDLLSQYELEFQAFSTQLKRMLSVFIQGGPHTSAEVTAFFEGTGFDAVANGFVAKYKSVIDYTKQVSKASGIPMVLPDRSLSLLSLYKDNQVQKILGASEEIMRTVTDASFRYGIGESKLNTIINELSAVIDTTGRRIVTEAVTGASIYDRTIKFEQFKHADVEKYFYDGPVDSKNRDECAATLGDGRQSTGWTIADIQSSQTPFTTCGGYNCRHEWLPMVPGLDDLIKDMQKDAGIKSGDTPISGGGIKKAPVRRKSGRRTVDRERVADERKAQKDFKREISKQDKIIKSTKNEIAELKARIKKLGG